LISAEGELETAEGSGILPLTKRPETTSTFNIDAL